MRLISWNINGAVGARALLQAKHLTQREPDIVCLQEVRLSAATLIAEHLATRGLTFVRHTASERGGRARKIGVLIAARWNMQVNHARAPWPEKLLSVRIKTRHPIELDVVHVPNGSQNGSIKLKTLRAARRRVDSRRGPLILCGDFNAPQAFVAGGIVTWGQRIPSKGSAQVIRAAWAPAWHEAESLLWSSSGLHDACKDCHRPNARVGSYRSRSAERWFDHVFVTPEIRVRRARYLHAWRRKGLSDHSAIEAIIGI